MFCVHGAGEKLRQSFAFTRSRAACVRRSLARSLPVTLACVMAFSATGSCQDTGSREKEFFGNGAEIAVTVYDNSGEPISTPAMVKLYREGSSPSGQGATSRGRVSFIVTSLGEFTVVVEAAGYPTVQQDVSVRTSTRAIVDVYLHRESLLGKSAAAPGKAILAPKARDAFDRGLRALSSEKLPEAEKCVGEAARLAPGHPDVLYVQGVLSLMQHNFVDAQSALEKATQVDPANARAFAALGMALSDQGKYQAAIAPLETSLKLDGGAGFETHWALAKADYKCERYDDALRNSQLALTESKGKAPEIQLLVAQSLAAVGKYDEAAEVLLAFLKEHSDRPEATKARRWLGRLGERNKKMK